MCNSDPYFINQPFYILLLYILIKKISTYLIKIYSYWNIFTNKYYYVNKYMNVNIEQTVSVHTCKLQNW